MVEDFLNNLKKGGVPPYLNHLKLQLMIRKILIVQSSLATLALAWLLSLKGLLLFKPFQSI
jgi:hypothetical protein